MLLYCTNYNVPFRIRKLDLDRIEPNKTHLLPLMIMSHLYTIDMVVILKGF